MDSISDIARRLADNAESVCRRYLPRGRREGRYWLVGNIHGAPGRSLYVRLSASVEGGGRVGKWTDAESGEHGDLLDIIAASCGHRSMHDTLAEARRFLSLPMPCHDGEASSTRRASKAPSGSPEAARRLWAASRRLAGSIADRYLSTRAIVGAPGEPALRSHPRCYYRASAGDAPGVRRAWPALIAAVTDEKDAVTGVHRTWLDPAGGKAPVANPRRAMGQLLGNGVRFGASGPVMIAGEGLETILSLRQIAPSLPMIAGLSAAHLAAIRFPGVLRRLYVARDDDAAGEAAVKTLSERAGAAGIELVPLHSVRDDFNTDLCALGRADVRTRLAAQLAECDRGHLQSE
ncbi:hypothetical protein GGC65_002376 [Sphingopyxis sp. OAS728]|uniref:DUF7146 domain-containing protein n=1 Tax=Sphingopyxis sp. OAS728 TaxID=2663823 RepID=UPI00178ADEAD|nr:toprim domain-containing protein [Sphingopyxis sp. OAS728]MBE1527920.1 hypothetical protein [Sphingopyxis sp. OAS728]